MGRRRPALPVTRESPTEELSFNPSIQKPHYSRGASVQAP